jgi:hypothetical protein
MRDLAWTSSGWSPVEGLCDMVLNMQVPLNHQVSGPDEWLSAFQGSPCAIKLVSLVCLFVSHWRRAPWEPLMGETNNMVHTEFTVPWWWRHQVPPKWWWPRTWPRVLEPTVSQFKMSPVWKPYHSPSRHLVPFWPWRCLLYTQICWGWNG